MLKVTLGITGDEFRDLFSVWAGNAWGEFNSRYAVLDSGAEVNVSGIREDFISVSEFPDVSLNGVDGPINDGKPCAYRGVLKRNNLHIGSAVWYPKLGNERLISSKWLTNEGWKITLSGKKTHGCATIDEICMRNWTIPGNCRE